MAQQTLGIVAIVNDGVISMYDLATRISLIIASTNQRDTPEARQRLANQVLHRLIDEKLKMQEANRLGISISQAALERSFEDLESRNGMAKGGLTAFLAGKGIERTALLEQIEAEIAWSRTVNTILRGQIIIGDEEVDEILAEIEAGKGKPEYLVAEIFIPVDRPDAAPEALATADKIHQQILAGADFRAIARNFSQSASAAVGGDLGWIRQGQLGTSIDATLAALKDGEVSAPVQTLAGYYILLKQESRIGEGLVSDDEKVSLQQIFVPLPANPSEGDIEAQTELAQTMANSISGCEDMEKLGKEYGSPLSGSLGTVKTVSLPAPIRSAVQSLKIGKASRPIRTGDGLTILMVCERSGTSAIESVRANIENRLLNERLDIAARRYLRDLRHAAFVDVRL